jgi:hypothetical protein
MPAMDAELVQAIELSEEPISPQRLLHTYCAAHRKRHGADFSA